IHLPQYLDELVATGSNRIQIVTAPGKFSVRGGIIDSYPMTEKYPIRVELFDDEVDSIRYFNTDTQRSLEQINEITIHPAEEILLTQNEFLSAGQKLENLLNETMKSLKTNTAKEKLLESVSYDIERLKSGEKFTGMSIYNAYFY